MTLIAFDFIGKNMLIMNEVGIVVFIKPFYFPVALITIVSRDNSITDNGVAVAIIAFKAVIKHGRVIES